MFLINLYHVFKVLGFPLFITPFLSFIFLKRRHFYLVLFVVLSCYTFRLFYHNQSSRYYSFFIILFFIITSYCLKDLNINRFILFLFAFVFFVFNLIRSFALPSSNNYYHYIFDTFNMLEAKDPHSLFFVSHKDYSRFLDYPNSKIFLDEQESIRSICDSYYYYGDNIYVLLKSSNNLDSLLFGDFYSLPFTPFLNLYCSNNDSIIYLLQLHPFSNSPSPLFFSTQNNLIFGGDMETTIDSKTINVILSKWIKDDASFYRNKDILWPSSDYLVNSWTTYPDKNYPFIFLDSCNSISDCFSLHVTFRGANQTPLYFFNKIKSQDCVLSFKIRSLDCNSFLTLYRYDYSAKGLIRPKRNNYIFIRDSSIHEYSFNFSKKEFEGDDSIFILSGSNTSFILDDVFCFPLKK